MNIVLAKLIQADNQLNGGEWTLIMIHPFLEPKWRQSNASAMCTCMRIQNIMEHDSNHVRMLSGEYWYCRVVKISA